MKLFDTSISALEKSLDLRFQRHAVLASNIANAETPNYRARELDFAGELERAIRPSKNDASSLKTTNPKHMDLGSSQGSHVVMDNSMATGADGNNVDLDIAMNRLADNSRTYTGAISLLTVKLRLLRSVARGSSMGG